MNRLYAGRALHSSASPYAAVRMLQASASTVGAAIVVALALSFGIFVSCLLPYLSR